MIDHFILPPSAWWDSYYDPIEARLATLRATHGDEAAYARRIDQAQAEIDLHHRHVDRYGYLFVVMRLP